MGPLWQTRRDFWADRAGNETALRANFLSRTATRKRHLGTSPNVSLYNPDLWTDEFAFLSRPGQSDIQTGLFYNYRTNVASYPTWRRAFAATSRRSSYFWGRFDPSFQVEEAEAFGRDVPSAQIHILDADHFALDEQPDLVAHLTRQFLLSAPIRWTGRHAALVSGSPQMTQICVISGNCVACSSAK